MNLYVLVALQPPPNKHLFEMRIMPRLVPGRGRSSSDHAREHGRECSLYAAHGSTHQPSHQAWQTLSIAGEGSARAFWNRALQVDLLLEF